jgi:glycosyltransferase involved in cell wall biosynthesis
VYRPAVWAISIARVRRSSSSPRALWVTEEPPGRELGGGSVRQAHLLEALASRFAVDLVTIGTVADRRVRAAAASVVELPRRWPPRPSDPVGRRALELGLLLVSPYPTSLYAAAPARRALAEAIGRRHGRHDLVCVEHETLAPLARGRHGGRWLITLHNRLSGMIASEIGRAPGWRQRWFRTRDLRKAQQLERWTVQSFDRCVASSEEDAAALAALAGEAAARRLAVVPNGVDVKAFTPTPVPREPRVLFPGRLAFEPNVDAVRWFCAEIWPAIRTAVPEATLVIAGRSPHPEVRALERLPGVSVQADVPSMVPHFRAARVVVVPLRTGTGTRLKALEAMASGRPVAGTAVGLEGIGVRDGVNALVADAPAGLAAAVIELLRRDELAGALGAAGRAHVERRYDWERIGACFAASAAALVEASR